MKANTIIVVLVTAVPLVGTALAQNAHLNLRLGPRAQNVSVKQGDTNEKNFTHDDLFALQKRFLDNFIAPNNDIQVRLRFRPLCYLC